MHLRALEPAKRHSRRIAALGGVALALLVSAVPAQATPGNGLAIGHDAEHGNGLAIGHAAAHNGHRGHKVA